MENCDYKQMFAVSLINIKEEKQHIIIYNKKTNKQTNRKI